jgi:putative endonuclease
VTGRPTTRQRTGRVGEAIAADYARQRGWIILEANVRLTSGEIDLVVLDTNELAFIEVRTRRVDTFGTGPESLTNRKRDRMAACAYEYLVTRGHDPDATPWRVDLIAIALASGRDPDVEHLADVLTH